MTSLEEFLFGVDTVVGIFVVLGVEVLLLGNASRLRYIAAAREKIDSAATTFGIGGTGREAAAIHHGAVVAAEGETLIAPLSRRRCVAYCVHFGFAVDELALVHWSWNTAKSVPFILEGGRTVDLGERFHFSVGSTALRAEFHPSRIDSEQRQEFDSMHRVWWLSAPFERKQLRFYEWVLPVGSTCAIAGEHSTAGEYRGASEVRLDQACILLVSPHEAGAVERLGRERVALAKLEKYLRWSRWLYVPIGLVALAGVIGVGLWLR